MLEFMKKNWIYEVVVSVKDKDKLHYAPMGVLTHDGEHAVLEMYESSETCRKIIEKRNLTVNFTGSMEVLYSAVIKELDDDFFADAPSAALEVEEVIDLGGKYRFICGVKSINKKNEIEENMVNRAKFLILECLIYYTKPNNNADKLKEISKFYEKIKTVAPGSDYERMAYNLAEKIRNSKSEI